MKTDGGTRADLARSVLSVPPLARNADFAPNANRAMIRQKLTGLSITNCKAGVTNAVVLAVSREQHAVISAFKTSMFTVRSFLIRHACPRHTSEFENEPLQALRQA